MYGKVIVALTAMQNKLEKAKKISIKFYFQPLQLIEKVAEKTFLDFIVPSTTNLYLETNATWTIL